MTIRTSIQGRTCATTGASPCWLTLFRAAKDGGEAVQAQAFATGTWREWIANLPDHALREAVEGLSEDAARVLLWDWRLWARPEQVAPEGDWRVWLVLAGRGWGKTRTGAEWIREQVEVYGRRRVALVAPTAADARDVMVEGESGILAVSPPWNRPVYEPSKRRVVWPNGAMATLYSAEEPERLRGPQHDAAWADELAAWKYPEAWDQLQFGLRLGPDPRVVVTTTPKPLRVLKAILAHPATALTRGSTYENAANLPPAFLEKIIARYEGTRLGRQELFAEILEDVPGALWKREQLENLRAVRVPELVRVVVGVDPAAGASELGSETGIVVAGLGVDGRGYVLEDASLAASPDAWARAAVAAYHKYGADRLVAEVNQGGDMVRHTVYTVDRKVAFKPVRASRGKQIRAEPVSALYEQGRVHHVGQLGALEDQMCTWVPGEKSPDRLDALVWALTELMIGGPPEPGIF